MGESVPCLQQSVSFGRFEHDSLCWERWSTFPTNKYLEEVEKCSTPGSVAQKKAYFEAHYKKIAARKAELMDQEKKREAESMSSEDQSQTTSMSSVCNTCEEESDAEKEKAEDPAAKNEMKIEGAEFMKEVADDHGDLLSHGADTFDQEREVSGISSNVSVHIDESNDNENTIYENEDFQLQDMDAGKYLCPEMDIPDIDKLEEPVCMEEEGASMLDSRDMEELTQDKAEEIELADKVTQDVAELDGLKKLLEELVQYKVDERKVVKEGAEDVKELGTSNETLNELPLDRVEDGEVAIQENEDLVKSENPMKIAQELLQDKFETREFTEKETKAPVRLENPKKMQKELPIKKTTSTTNARKKPASPMPKKSSPMPKKSSPMPKLPMLNTPKSSKPALSKTAMHITRPSAKKENGSTPSSMMRSPMQSTPKPSSSDFSKTSISTSRPLVKKEIESTLLTSKKATGSETKRVLPTSLHMPLSLGPSTSDPAPQMTTRKSLIMEKMGDKDIVKRAFKAFRNLSHFSPSSLARAPATDQIDHKKVEKGSALDVSLKKHEGIAKTIRPSSPASGQLGTRKTAVSPGLYKISDVDKRNGKSLPASLSLRSQYQGHKKQEVSKNLEQKSRTKGAGETHLESKVKLEKPAPIKTPSREISKAKLSSSYNQEYGFFKGLQKDASKSQASG